jgi:hypothetical protein
MGAPPCVWSGDCAFNKFKNGHPQVGKPNKFLLQKSLRNRKRKFEETLRDKAAALLERGQECTASKRALHPKADRAGHASRASRRGIEARIIEPRTLPLLLFV